MIHYHITGSLFSFSSAVEANMTVRHFALSRSVILDVLRAIVSRPISPTALARQRPQPLILTSKTLWLGSCQRAYSTQALLLDPKNDTQEEKKDRYHYFTKKLPNGTKKLVKGFALKEKKEKPKHLMDYNKRMMYAILENRVNKAVQLLRDMENNHIKPDLSSYTIIINGYSTQGDMFRAKKWMKRMMQNGIEPDAYVYTSLIDGYMREANVDKAETTFRSMMSRNIQPTLVTYNILMHHSVRQLNMESALRFWSNLLEAGLKSDVYTFAIVLHGLGDEGRVDEAWRIFNRMQQEEIDVNEVVATTLMGMHVKQHDNEYAVDLFHKFFKTKPLKPTHHTRNVLLNAVIANADTDTIKKYYGQYKEHLAQKDRTGTPLFIGANVYTYTTFMRAFLRRNDLSMVSQVYKDMAEQHIQPTLVTYATLMLAHAYVPDPESCSRILNSLKSSGIKLNAVLYTIVMRAYAKAGRWEQVRQTYELMKQDKVEPTKLTMEVLRYGRHNADK
ncbi:hypothetical protein CU098_005541 [Rhizopus stolonifer]|uniref:PROP1-like PPR domain-containing protein n=1 Tax=Rhizopus stolonifer TaxID=4846 RepID=A0A367KMN3_RHIST|nr:hypothetical protein CU098_005541 [Rhizopus stolonifer]